MAIPIRLSRCRGIPGPAGGLFRVTAWHEPFEPPPPPTAIEDDAIDDDRAGRWDDPLGQFRTLYCASQAEGAIGEKLADFAQNSSAAVRVEAYMDDDADPEHIDDQLLRPLHPEDIESFRWRLAWAPVLSHARFLDVNHWRTHVATAPAAAELLARFGLNALDRRALLDERGNFTRRLAGLWHGAATAQTAVRSVCGLRYRSRLPPAWFCWALWEPLPFDPSAATTELVTIDHPALRKAARMLGVELAE